MAGIASMEALDPVLMVVSGPHRMARCTAPYVPGELHCCGTRGTHNTHVLQPEVVRRKGSGTARIAELRRGIVQGRRAASASPADYNDSQ